MHQLQWYCNYEAVYKSFKYTGMDVGQVAVGIILLDTLVNQIFYSDTWENIVSYIAYIRLNFLNLQGEIEMSIFYNVRKINLYIWL